MVPYRMQQVGLLSIVTLALGFDLVSANFQAALDGRGGEPLVQELLVLAILILPILQIFHLFRGMYQASREGLSVRTALYIYIDLSFIFASIYFIFYILSLYFGVSTFYVDSSIQIEFGGLHIYDRILAVMQLYIEFLYYSFSTIATLGAYSVGPTFWFTKILTIIQVGVGVYMVSVAISINANKAGVMRDVA